MCKSVMSMSTVCVVRVCESDCVNGNVCVRV